MKIHFIQQDAWVVPGAILVEADYIANACECGYSVQSIQNFMARIMQTETGKRLCRQIFQL